VISCKILHRYGPGVITIAQEDVELEFVPTVGSIVKIDTDNGSLLRGRVVGVEHYITRGGFSRGRWQQECSIMIDTSEFDKRVPGSITPT